jgi:hypothetical protein
MMEEIKRVPEPVLVMQGDKFIHDKLNGVIREHSTTDKSATKITLDNIFASYQRIMYKDGSIIDVVVYHDDLVKAKDKSKMKSDQGLWQTWPGEASKKTATNRAFRLYHKYPDNVVLYGNDNDSEDESGQPAYQEARIEEPTPPAQTQPSAEDKKEDFKSNVNESTGEVYEEAKVVEKSKKKTDSFI